MLNTVCVKTWFFIIALSNDDVSLEMLARQNLEKQPPKPKRAQPKFEETGWFSIFLISLCIYFSAFVSGRRNGSNGS